MISAIVFDCFGVLTTDGWLPFKHKNFGQDQALLEQATDLNKQTNCGLLSYPDFMAQIAGLAGITAAEARRQIESNVANEPLFVYIDELKQHYKIGLLSNAAANWLPDMFTPAQLASFDAIALSYETGFVKPDPRSYEIIAERLGVDMQECVLIDDQERYCTAAREAGMQAIWYRGDVDQTRSELNKLLEV
ncbi:MAG: HAD-superfamily hydrolase, subfamily variant 3 [Candidatus Saccharibacteria bacterium]|nr:HAD-superfamily hydrolase, subfamily variant 3 [Candidatus Saccharibacteria bacterium]